MVKIENKNDKFFTSIAISHCMCVSKAGEMKSTLRLEEIKISLSLAGFRLWYSAIYQNNDNKFPRCLSILALSLFYFPHSPFFHVNQAKKLFGETKIYISNELDGQYFMMSAHSHSDVFDMKAFSFIKASGTFFWIYRDVKKLEMCGN